jgi:hypothetical protein
MDRLWRVRSRWMRADSTTYLGCPRNNQFFVSVRTEKNRNSICFSCFSVCFAKPKNFFPVCFGVSERYRNNQKTKTNRTFSKQTKKISKKLYFGCPLNNYFFFGSNQNKPKLNLFRLFFGVCGSQKRNLGGLFRCFGLVSKQTKPTKLMVWGIKRFIFKQICCCFSWPFFVSVVLKHRNSLFQYESETTETNVLFRIVLKLVSVPVLVVSIRN